MCTGQHCPPHAKRMGLQLLKPGHSSFQRCFCFPDNVKCLTVLTRHVVQHIKSSTNEPQSHVSRPSSQGFQSTGLRVRKLRVELLALTRAIRAETGQNATLAAQRPGTFRPEYPGHPSMLYKHTRESWFLEHTWYFVVQDT